MGDALNGQWTMIDEQNIGGSGFFDQWSWIRDLRSLEIVNFYPNAPGIKGL